MWQHKAAGRLSGLSLVELIISIFLGSVLSLAIAKVYLEGLRNFLMEDEMSRLHDSGRFALTLLSNELRFAGLLGSMSPVGDISPRSVGADCTASGNWALDATIPMDFVDNFDALDTGVPVFVSGATPTCLNAADIEAGTDILSLKRTAGNFTLGNGAYPAGVKLRHRQWYLRVQDYGADNQWVYNEASNFPAQDVGENTHVDYWEYYARIYYIRSFSETGNDSIPSLCVESLIGGSGRGAMATRCLIEGVEDMQIEFGIDTNLDGVPNQFKSAPTKFDMAKVVAVRLHLLMRSINEITGYTRAGTYKLGNKNLSRHDGYLRRVMHATISTPNLNHTGQ